MFIYKSNPAAKEKYSLKPAQKLILSLRKETNVEVAECQAGAVMPADKWHIVKH